MYLGMNSGNGNSLSDFGHIQQSISDILLTPIGTRVMRRTYGSKIFDLIDQPNNPATRMRVMSAVVMALTFWEPRVEITKVDFLVDKEKLTVLIEGRRTDTATAENFSTSLELK